MASYNLGFAWTPILLEAAENVRSSIRNVLLKRYSLDLTELKQLIDYEAQKAIEDTMRHHDVSVRIISEEGETIIGEEKMYLIVDPVDGTTNLARGLPFAVTSLALSETMQLSDTIASLVMDLYTGDIYRAERNKGAWRGLKQIQPSTHRILEEAIISMDISKGAHLKKVEKIIAKARHIRQLGCAALSLCLVASGVLDAHIDLRDMLRSTDAAAGLLILKESGGEYSIDGTLNGDLKLRQQSKLNLVAASGRELIDNIHSL